jgi:hypothetical protein
MKASFKSAFPGIHISDWFFGIICDIGTLMSEVELIVED